MLFAQGRQNPSLDHLHAHFDFGLVARLARARRHHRNTVVPRHLLVGEIDARLIAAAPCHSGFQIVRDHDLRHAAEEFKRAHVRADPVGQALCPGCFGERVVAGAEHGDE